MYAPHRARGYAFAEFIKHVLHRDIWTCKNQGQVNQEIQSWTGPCITPSPCINVTFPPSTTNNIEIFCTLHAVNNST